MAEPTRAGESSGMIKAWEAPSVRELINLDDRYAARIEISARQGKPYLQLQLVDFNNGPRNGLSGSNDGGQLPNVTVYSADALRELRSTIDKALEYYDAYTTQKALSDDERPMENVKASAADAQGNA